MNGFGLMLHHFHNHKEHILSQGSIDADEFERMLNILGKRANILSAPDWYKKATKNKLSEKDVCITFDDSLRCQYDVALPVLDKIGLKAFWFIYTGPIENKATRLEVYRYYRFKVFKNINEFYSAFEKVISKSAFRKKVRDALKDFRPSQFLSDYSFYTAEDKKFRFIRNFVLGQRDYETIMDKMIKDSKINLGELAKILWLDKSNIQNLWRKKHIIGLHSHTHPYTMGQLAKDNQRFEYQTNYTLLKEMIGEDVVAMSHPCDSYNKDTLDILNDLKIKIGFRATMSQKEYSNLEFPRLDHGSLIPEIRG